MPVAQSVEMIKSGTAYDADDRFDHASLLLSRGIIDRRRGAINRAASADKTTRPIVSRG
jgi:hypothetical protein